MNSTASGLTRIRRGSAGGPIAAFAMILVLAWLAPNSESPATVPHDPFVALLWRLASNL